MSSACWRECFSLALMFVRRSVDPYHLIALFYADTESGLADYVRSHRIIAWHPRFLDYLLSRNAAVAAILAHDYKDKTGELIGQCHGNQLERLALQEPVSPASQRVTVLFAMIEHGMRAQLPEIRIAHLRDAIKSGLATRGVLPRHEPQERRELARSGKS